MASRILANLIVSGGQVLLRAAAAAYQKALVSACPLRALTRHDRACRILGRSPRASRTDTAPSPALTFPSSPLPQTRNVRASRTRPRRVARRPCSAGRPCPSKRRARSWGWMRSARWRMSRGATRRCLRRTRRTGAFTYSPRSTGRRSAWIWSSWARAGTGTGMRGLGTARTPPATRRKIQTRGEDLPPAAWKTRPKSKRRVPSIPRASRTPTVVSPRSSRREMTRSRTRSVKYYRTCVYYRVVPYASFVVVERRNVERSSGQRLVCFLGECGETLGVRLNGVERDSVRAAMTRRATSAYASCRSARPSWASSEEVRVPIHWSTRSASASASFPSPAAAAPADAAAARAAAATVPPRAAPRPPANHARPSPGERGRGIPSRPARRRTREGSRSRSRPPRRRRGIAGGPRRAPPRAPPSGPGGSRARVTAQARRRAAAER